MGDLTKYLFLSLILIISESVEAQNLGDWEVYSSFSTVNSIAQSGSVIYGATLGGIFVVEGNEIGEAITTLEGLYRSDPTSIAYDETGNRLFAGYIDGTIDVINLDNGEINRLEDIQRVDRFNTKRINAFDIYEDQLYVSAGFGIVVYNLENLFVENSYLRLGDFTTGALVSNVHIHDNTIYVAASEGVATGNLNSNLVESSNWVTYDATDGLPGLQIQDIVLFNSDIYALADENVYELQGENWIVSSDFAGMTASFISTNEQQSSLAVAGTSRIRLLDSSGGSEDFTPDITSPVNSLMLDNGTLFVGTRNEGIVVVDISSNSSSKYLPSGPYLNFFTEMVTEGSELIAVSTDAFPQSDPFNSIRGYYIYNDGMWDNYNINTNEVLNQYNFSAAQSIAYNDTYYYIGSWGGGVVRHNKETGEIDIYNTSNSNLIGWRDAPNYLVVSGLAADSQENMWLISSDSELPLNVNLDGSDEWIGFPQEIIGASTYFDIFIDSYDQKWIPLIDNLSSGNGTGLLVLNTGDPENPDDDRSIRLTDSPDNGNLPDREVNAIIQDDNDEVWIGTDRGIARFIFPELVIDGGANERRAQWLINEDTTASSRFLLRDVNVSAMAVNGANQKWIGSRNQGVWLLNEEGSAILERFTKENSPLLSDVINDITIIEETGEVLISTDLGLVSYRGIPQAPQEEMDKLKVFPNPFNYNRHDQIVVEGLSEITQIKILGIDGVVVNEISGRGGRLSWNGLDYNGNRLGSGVYFVVAYEESGSQKGIGKVVIIR